MPGRLCCLLLVFCVSPVACLVVPSSCPPGCCCQGLLVLCESLGLQSLPRSVPLGTSALSVARNQLCNVDHLLRTFLGLQELSLSHNQLARFPRGLPPSLETLQLQENHITYITSGVLRQLGNLTRLDLEDNRIRAIQPEALLGLRKLLVLTLKGNRLTSLPLNLPSSLTHLDLSANCISALDLPSMTSLVNLMVLKINSNCLRSVPDHAFDSLLRLRSLALANNLWVCECDILYLYRWLLSGKLRMATDLVCTEPLHLAHRLLLNLSVMTICPRVLNPKGRALYFGLTSQPDRGFATSTVPDADAGEPSGREAYTIEEMSSQPAKVHQNPLRTHILSGHFTLEALSYNECLSLNLKSSERPTIDASTSSSTDEEIRCKHNSTTQHPVFNSTSVEVKESPLPTDKAGPLLDPTSSRIFPQNSSAVIALLAVICLLVVLLIVAVLLVLKKILVHHQRVAPLQQS